MKKITLLFFAVLFVVSQLVAKEGMWIPLLLEKYKLEDMQKMGFKLTAEDIYNVNNASMKDAVMVFGGGCTAELISGEGLLITNHHCGYRQIQSHSSVENDYLTNGFWAMNRDEELPNPGLTVSFLEYMKDVTDGVLSDTEDLSGRERENKIKANISQMEKEAAEDGKFQTRIKPLFYGNQYFLYVYKVFKDVRLVGAPPSAIGKFGGDTDNWMWPRHTGDFSLFRIYADQNNEPAEYSPDNVPYQPKKFFPISMKGIQPGDFTMVFGNPGSTMQYIPSNEVDIIMNQRDPDRIAIREKKLAVIGEDMETDPKVRIQYAAKYASISNAWKKWQGEILGLERLDAVNKKLAFEEEFQNWAKDNGTWEGEYRQVFANFDKLYGAYGPFIRAYDYYSEIVRRRGVETFQLADRLNGIINNIENKQTDRVERDIESLKEFLPRFFKDFNQPTDEKLFEVLLPLLGEDLDNEFLPDHYTEVMDKYGDKLIDKIYRKSVLHDQKELTDLLESGNEKQLLKLRKDPMVKLYNRLIFHFETIINPVVDSLNIRINENMKTYMAGILEMNDREEIYPDANLTLRVTYGKVEGYEPRDGVKYKHYTTLEGIMEKDNPEIYDYDVPERLRQLYETKDYGQYAEDDYLPVCFVASNHTTGGNSGSPVVNGNGELIGVNFDRCWEGTMSDIMYDPDRCRNIAIDIRYALFLIDKFAGAGYLLNEMELMD